MQIIRKSQYIQDGLHKEYRRTMAPVVSQVCLGSVHWGENAG